MLVWVGLQAPRVQTDTGLAPFPVTRSVSRSAPLSSLFVARFSVCAPSSSSPLAPRPLPPVLRLRRPPYRRPLLRRWALLRHRARFLRTLLALCFCGARLLSLRIFVPRPLAPPLLRPAPAPVVVTLFSLAVASLLALAAAILALPVSPRCRCRTMSSLCSLRRRCLHRDLPSCLPCVSCPFRALWRWRSRRVRRCRLRRAVSCVCVAPASCRRRPSSAPAACLRLRPFGIVCVFSRVVPIYV